MSVQEAIQVLVDEAVAVPPGRRHLRVAQVAELLAVSDKWVRAHLDEFPRAWKMRGGDIRVPQADVDALVKRSAIGRTS